MKRLLLALLFGLHSATVFAQASPTYTNISILNGGTVGTNITGTGSYLQGITQFSNTKAFHAGSGSTSRGLGTYVTVDGETPDGTFYQGFNAQMFTSATAADVQAGTENAYFYYAKNRPTGGIPGGQVMASGWNIWANAQDFTNGDTALVGGLVNEFDVQRNGSDSANLAYGIAINASPMLAQSAGGYPAEWYSLFQIFSGSADGSLAKTFIKPIGAYSQAVLDLRYSFSLPSTVLTPLGSPSTTLHVSNVLNFTSAGTALLPVSSGNPLPVWIGTNATPYQVIGYAFDALSGGSQPRSGTLTFSSAVSTTDGTAGNAVTLRPDGIWLNTNEAIAWDNGNNFRTYSDQATDAVYFDGVTGTNGYRIGKPTDYLGFNDFSIQPGGSANSGNLGLYSSSTGIVFIGQPGAAGLEVLNASGTFDTGLQIIPGTVGNPVALSAQSSSGNGSISISTTGGGTIALNGATTATPSLAVGTPTAELNLTTSSIQAIGSGTTYGLTLAGKGTGNVNIGAISGQAPLVVFGTATSLANNIGISGGTTGNPVSISAFGTDPNVSMTLAGQGAGLVNINSLLSLKPYTVATLPTCNSGLSGTMAVVNDAASPTYNATLTGGSGSRIPVFCNGTAWTAH